MANRRQVKKNLKKYGQKIKGRNKRNLKEPAESHRERVETAGYVVPEGPGDR